MEETSEEEASFYIPELPEGSLLTLELISNWGDPTYIALNGIEIFTETGKRPTIKEISCSSSYDGDLQSLFIHSFSSSTRRPSWRTSLSSTPSLSFQFVDSSRIAMIRIWNCNESRVHATRGVRELIIRLDNIIIFKGEINCSYSKVDSEYEPMGDTVLFTTNEAILEKIADNDVCLIVPDIARSTSTLDIYNSEEAVGINPMRPQTTERKTTAEGGQQRPKSATTPDNNEEGGVRVIHLELISNWGYNGQIGMTGIELITRRGKVIDPNILIITSSHGNNTVNRLLNGKNLTRSREDMWIADYDGKPVTITIQLQTPTIITGISIWNYNASVELSYAGVKTMHIHCNGRLYIGNVLLRKALGAVFFDFVQDISLENVSFTRSLQQQRPSTHTIGGFIFQLCLQSTWGDEFYIGLNGIELYNRKNELVRLKSHNLAAFPESINILPSMENDPRSSEKLINGNNITDKASNMWLTPVFPNRQARVFFIFDNPTYISKIVVYNYSKTPSRGVRDITLSVDDLMVFSGEVPVSSSTQVGILEINTQE